MGKRILVGLTVGILTWTGVAFPSLADPDPTRNNRSGVMEVGPPLALVGPAAAAKADPALVAMGPVAAAMQPQVNAAVTGDSADKVSPGVQGLVDNLITGAQGSIVVGGIGMADGLDKLLLGVTVGAAANNNSLGQDLKAAVSTALIQSGLPLPDRLHLGIVLNKIAKQLMLELANAIGSNPDGTIVVVIDLSTGKVTITDQDGNIIGPPAGSKIDMDPSDASKLPVVLGDKVAGAFPVVDDLTPPGTVGDFENPPGQDIA